MSRVPHRPVFVLCLASVLESLAAAGATRATLTFLFQMACALPLLFAMVRFFEGLWAMAGRTEIS